jgi:hypothetical protein
MLSATKPGWELASEDCQLADEDGSKPVSLVVQLRRCTYVFPYFRLIYAGGDSSQVQIAWASHMVTITGHRSRLGCAAGCLSLCGGPGITDITVEQFK